MFGRERVVPSILAAVGAVLAGMLVGSGFAGRSGDVVKAVAVQAVMPPAAHASVADPSDPSAAQGASVGRRVAVAVRRAPVARVTAQAATRHSRPARTRAGKHLGQVKADPPAPSPATSRAAHSRRHHHPHAARRHRHPGRHHGAHRHDGAHRHHRHAHRARHHPHHHHRG